MIVQVRRVVLDAEPAARTLLHVPAAAAVEILDGGVVADEERPPVAKVRPDTTRGPQDRLDVGGKRKKARPLSRMKRV